MAKVIFHLVYVPYLLHPFLYWWSPFSFWKPCRGCLQTSGTSLIPNLDLWGHAWPGWLPPQALLPFFPCTPKAHRPGEHSGCSSRTAPLPSHCFCRSPALPSTQTWHTAPSLERDLTICQGRGLLGHMGALFLILFPWHSWLTKHRKNKHQKLWNNRDRIFFFLGRANWHVGSSSLMRDWTHAP